MDKNSIKQGLDEIALVDADITNALAMYGYPAPRIRPKGIETFFAIVVGQQLSTHAAASIMTKARSLLPEITAEAISQQSDDSLRAVGLSKQKVSYIKGMADAILSRSFDPDGLPELDDKSVIETITALKGFGPWSAEIYCMFSLQRPDIFPSGDLALLVALQKLKGLDEKPTPKQAQTLIQHWSPWRSVGSLFLWHYYHGIPT